MKLKEIIKEFESIAPLSLQEDWDNSGFQLKLKNDNDEISRVLICLEITSETVKEAIDNKVELIITHHPLFFYALKEISLDTYLGSFVKDLISNNISVYSSHTSFDICDGGNNDYFGKLLGVTNINKIPTDTENISRYGDLDKEYSLSEFVSLLENTFNISKEYFNYAGPKSLNIKRIAWVTGAGDDYIINAKDVDSDLFITGDLSYHKARDAKELNMPTIAIGHFASEFIFSKNVKELLNKIGDKVDLIESKIDINPYESLK